MKILIADDDAVSRRMMNGILVHAGYEVVAVENGRQAVDALGAADGPRLALIDWVMPELDGPGVCGELRTLSDRSYVYIILLTSKDSKSDIVAGLEAGADDFLTKPCNADEVKARLRTGQRILQLEDKLVEAREEMRYKATHDGLTRLWNRGAILSLLDRELNRMQREGGMLSLLLCDLDHFKRVNDTHGHLVGDEVLQELGNRLAAAVRPYDSVGRYGGEEFLVLLSGCNEALTAQRADEIHNSIRSIPFQTANGPLSLTISIGVRTCCHSSEVTAEELLNDADQALYRAKAKGRDCVSL